MADNIVLMDGAAGTCLWEKSGDTRPVWTYNIERPELVKELHREYIAAGSKLILSNTFCANSLAVEKEGYSVFDVASAGVRLAREAAEGTNVQVGLDIGPLTALLKPFGEVTHEQAHEIYRKQLEAGMSGKPDVIMLETFMDLEMMSIALAEAVSFGVPVLCSMSFTKFGKTLMGNTVEKIAKRLGDEGAAALGLNCSLGPDAALPILQKFAACTKLPLIFKPNAGMPDEDGDPGFDANAFADDVMKAVDMGAAYIGGCCGSTPAYIAAVNKRLLGV